jgi:5-methylcytosine-specific restriction protein A
MPTAGKRPCTHPGCPETLPRGQGPRCPAHTRARNARNHEARPPGYLGHLYSSRRWRRARKRFLSERPWCEASGCHNQPANEVDHIEPHRGDLDTFWNQDNWQALCKSCHSRKTMGEINKGEGG